MHTKHELNVLSMFEGLTVEEQFILDALRSGAMQFSESGHRMENGRTPSPYFFDLSVDETGDFIRSLAGGYIQTIIDCLSKKKGVGMPEVLFGPTWRSLPAIMAIRQNLLFKVAITCNLKEDEKSNGGNRFIGSSFRGKKVLIIDGAISTGISCARAVETVRRNGGIPIGHIVALDRQECGRWAKVSALHEFENRQGIPMYSIAKTSHLISVLKRIIAESSPNKVAEDMLGGILAYQKRYGVS